jgi:hypothetical protein
MIDTYSKAEVDLIVNSIKQHIDDSVKPTLERIESQTIRTNGRVQALEKWRVGLTVGIGLVAAMSAPNITAIAKVFTAL